MKKIRFTGADVAWSMTGSGMYCLIAVTVFDQPFEWYTWPVSFTIYLVVSRAINVLWGRK